MESEDFKNIIKNIEFKESYHSNIYLLKYDVYTTFNNEEHFNHAERCMLSLDEINNLFSNTDNDELLNVLEEYFFSDDDEPFRNDKD